MTQFLPIIFAAFVLALVATPVTRWLAGHLGMIDQPGVRKAHRSAVPLLGGMALYVAVTLAFVSFGRSDWISEGIGILGGATLMFLTGLWDDRFGMPARIKFGASAVAALFMIAFGVQVRLFDTPWLDWPITLLWVTGITHAVNLMDNMDGLAAGVTATASAVFLGLAVSTGQGLVASLASALLGSALGFLFYNFAPATSFMGDAGALPLGFLLAALGIQLQFRELPLATTWMAPILVLGVLIFDTTLVTVSRLRRGRSPFQGGSDHTSHRLVQLGLSRPRAVLTLYVVALVLGASAALLMRADPVTANGTFAALITGGLAMLWALDRVEPTLAGNPPTVLLAGSPGEPTLAALRSVRGLSHDITVVVANTHPRDEVVALLAELSPHPAEARRMLPRALGDAWPNELAGIQSVLQHEGVVLLADEAEPALRCARLIVIAPGTRALLDQAGLRAALQPAHGALRRPVIAWLGSAEDPARIGDVFTPAHLGRDLSRRLLQQAAGERKTAPDTSALV
jgi:UDP-GlcNAc:undecaprenyl-phosphate GlcNAc-1-phosphate transferase